MMSRFDKIILKIISGTSDSNINFSKLCNVIENMGFDKRIKGSHYIYYMDGIDEIINIQPLGNKAKAYQVKQVRNIIIKYGLLQEEL